MLEDDVDGAAGRIIAEVAAERRMEPLGLALDLLHATPA